MSLVAMAAIGTVGWVGGRAAYNLCRVAERMAEAQGSPANLNCEQYNKPGGGRPPWAGPPGGGPGPGPDPEPTPPLITLTHPEETEILEGNPGSPGSASLVFTRTGDLSLLSTALVRLAPGETHPADDVDLGAILVRIDGGEAISPGTGLGDHAIIFPQGSATAVLEIVFSGDTDVEPDETLVVSVLQAFDGVMAGDTGPVTLNDDLPPPQIALANTTPAPVREGIPLNGEVGWHTLTFTRTGDLSVESTAVLRLTSGSTIRS